MSTKQCLECGALLPRGASGGLCAACALRGALEAASDEGPVPQSQGTSGPDTAPAAFGAGSRLGDYELLEEIARGGMGVVYKARQKSLGRIVALKMLAFGPRSKPDFIKRFHAEAAVAASLQHPNIVGIHEVGVQEGAHYFVMDYAEGRNLAELASKGPLPAGRAARYVRAVAEAIHYAHERGILHRDLKPSNVLVDAQNQPRVTDFGLAKRFEGESQLTLSGQTVGSPGYLPPEQAEAGRGKVSRRSDVYGLGAILYHLLTGRPPFQAETLTEVLNQVLNVEPVAPHLLNPSIPRDLETICLKCLEKQPARRYANAQMVAEELGRFLEDRPILSRPVSGPEKLWRWCQRKPLAAVLALSLVLAGWLGWQAHRSSRQLEQEKMQVAIETALGAAWGGDQVAAEEGIRQAVRHGAPVEWVLMLNGQIALHRLRVDEAIKHLGQAVDVAPGSLAAKAMLAAAYLYSGQADQYAETMAGVLTRLEEQPPDTAVDCLCAGAALSATDPAKAVPLLEQALRQRASGVTFLQLALAEAFQAADAGSWSTARKALAHWQSARELLGADHPLVRTAGLNAWNFAIRLCPEGDRPGVLEGAAEAARALESTREPIGHMQRAFYFDLVGKEDAVVQEWEKTLQSGGVGLFVSWYAAAMCGRGRSAEAIERLAWQKPSTDGLTAVARANLFLDLDRAVEAEEIYRRIVTRPGYAGVLAETILLLAGQHERAATNCAQLLPAVPPQHPEYQTVRYLAGQCSREELVGSAGASRSQHCSAHYYIALSCLAKGEREAARRHFEQCVEAGTHWLPVFQWGRAFLARLDKDPRWPPWIQES